jgi:hypothetical protein
LLPQLGSMIRSGRVPTRRTLGALSQCAPSLGSLSTKSTSVFRRMCLIYVAHEDRWLNLSPRNFTGGWLCRVEGRFAGVNGDGPRASELQSYSSISIRYQATSYFEKYPLAKEQLLAHQDKSYFPGTISLDAFKIIYVAPMKALVQEMVGLLRPQTRSIARFNALAALSNAPSSVCCGHTPCSACRAGRWREGVAHTLALGTRGRHAARIRGNGEGASHSCLWEG